MIMNSLSRNYTSSPFDTLFFITLGGALIQGTLTVFRYFESQPLFPNYFVILIIGSFLLLFLRLAIGDYNFNRLSYSLGISRIINTKKNFLRRKQSIDGIVMVLQGVFFIVLSFFIVDPIKYLKVFYFLIFFNSIWLMFQVRCLNRIINCKAFKYFNSGGNETIESLMLKTYQRSKLQGIVSLWLGNNLLFIFLSAFFLLSNNHSNLILAIWVSFSIINSLLDYYLTHEFYHEPFDFIENKNIPF